MSRYIIGILAAMIIGQGLLISKQNELIDTLNVRADGMVDDINVCFEASQDYIVDLINCTTFAQSCQKAYKECTR